MWCPHIEVTPKHINRIHAPLNLVIVWVSREEAILAVDVLEVLAPLGVRLESHIALGVWAPHFHVANLVSISLPLED